MIKDKSNDKSNLCKGASLAFAGILALSFFPLNVIEVKADYLISGEIGSEAIYISNANQKWNKESVYEIRAAYFGSDKKIPIGLSDYSGYLGINYDSATTVESIESSVTVTYKTSGQNIKVSKLDDSVIKNVSSNPTSTKYGTVTLDNAGQYTINYSITLNLSDDTVKNFSTDYIVTSEITSAYFEFIENDSNIIPSVYDVSYQKAKGGLKNLNLTLPKVFGENEKELPNVVFIANGDTSSIQTSDYVDITISKGSKGTAVIEGQGRNFFIDSKYFNPDSDEFVGFGNYILKYSYYSNGQFITSVTKEFTVSEQYYEDYDYTIKTSSSLTSAITGVETTLPKITGQTSTSSKPSGETVNVSYKVIAYRLVNGSYSETKDGSIVDGKFTPWADGSYKIVYNAEDFYGNPKSTYFFIDGVKDSQKPVAQMYDASNVNNYVGQNINNKIDSYIDASNDLKSKTSVKNIIIFAVGATDNVSKVEDMKLTRVVKSSAKSITIDDYADYNLIFDYDFTSLITNNKYLENKLTAAGVEISNEESVLAWLKGNKFLIVTTDKTKTVEQGYAYLNINLTSGLMLNGSESGIPYTVLYYAQDKAGNESAQLSYQITVVSEEILDSVGPEITFPTNLKNSYRANSIITFDAPSASDDNDTRMEIITEYAYDGYDNWIQFEDDNYKIDLSEIEDAIYSDNKPTKLTIRVTAYDDYGNKGEWTKDISIADVQDTSAPIIMTESYETSNDSFIKQNSEIILPTITIADDYVEYLNAEVYVSRIKDGVETPISVKGKVEEKNVLNGKYILKAGKIVASYPGEYQVKVIITDAGNNQITSFYNYYVEDDNIIEDPVITGLASTIGNEGKAEVGEAIDLATPSVDYVIDEDRFGIFGVLDDDSKASFDYSVKVINDAPSSYKFNENEEKTFTAYEPGIYKLQYFVNVTIFDKNQFEINSDNTAVVEKGTSNKVVSVDENSFVILSDSTFKYALKSETDYKIYDLTSKFTFDSNMKAWYIQKDSVNYYVNVDEGFKLIARNGQQIEFSLNNDAGSNLTIGDTSYSISSSATLDLNVIVSYNLPSDVFTLTVSDTKAPEILVDYDYPSTADKNDIVSIKKVEAEELSVKGIDSEKSYVLISYKGGETSYSTQYYLSTWTTDSDYNPSTGNIDYKLTRDGNYTISYFVYDYYGNVNSEKSYTIHVGDCERPTIKIANGFIEEKFKLGETLTLDLSKLTFTDDVTTDSNKLLETLEVKVYNTATSSEELKNIANESEHRYSYKLDTAGTYKIEISVTDEAGWTKTETIQFEVSTDSEEGTEVYEVVGTVLIVVSVLVLAGVITYFVVSKIKKDKKTKSKGEKKDKNNK